MDFLCGLPRAEGKEVIFVVVDRLTKYAHFIPLAHPYTASSVALIFLDKVYRLHGLPSYIPKVTGRQSGLTNVLKTTSGAWYFSNSGSNGFLWRNGGTIPI